MIIYGVSDKREESWKRVVGDTTEYFRTKEEAVSEGRKKARAGWYDTVVRRLEFAYVQKEQMVLCLNGQVMQAIRSSEVVAEFPVCYRRGKRAV